MSDTGDIYKSIADLPLADTKTGDELVEVLQGGKPVTINVALEPNFSHVGLKAITHMPNGEDITADFIGSISLKLNSVKKFVPDDPDEEFEPPAAED